MSADEMLMGEQPCVVCRSIPYAPESSLAALCRHQEGLIDRLVQSGLERDLEHHATLDELDRVRCERDELRDDATRRNRRILELQAENDRLRARRAS